MFTKKVLLFFVLVLSVCLCSCVISGKKIEEKTYIVRFAFSTAASNEYCQVNEMDEYTVKLGDYVVFENDSTSLKFYCHEINSPNCVSAVTTVHPKDSATSYSLNVSILIDEEFVSYADENNVITLYSDIANCFFEGSKVTMKDGSQKNIEDINICDEVLTYNSYTGIFEPKKVLLLERSNVVKTCIYTVQTDSGKTVDIVSYHNFYDATNGEQLDIGFYNYPEKIGEKILSVNSNSFEVEEITNISVSYKKGRYYTIVTEDNLNCVVNGFLTMVPVYAAYVPFEMDSNYVVDAVKMQMDIENYGVFTYEDYPFDVSRNLFDKLGMKYHKILLEKGYVTYETLKLEIESCGLYFYNWK